jgi:hypothetical protein
MECQFSIEHWQDVLKQAIKMGYRFCSFDDYATGLNDDEFTILLRHDVDVSLGKALRLAEIESSLNVFATYFIRLQSRFYNPEEFINHEIITKLQNLNVEIGLHYDLQYYQEHGNNLHEMLETDVKKLSNLIGRPVRICSSHRPGRISTLNAIDIRRVGLMYEAYEPTFFTRVKYISDSRCHWREGCLCKWLGKVNNLTVLMHPIWWFELEMNKGVILERFKMGD